jgi:putative DNA primase/helicase
MNQFEDEAAFFRRTDGIIQAVEASAAAKRIVVFSEKELAEAFVASKAGNVLYCHDGQPSWLIWTGSHWERDKTAAPFDMVASFCKSVAATCNDYKIRKQVGGSRFCRGVEIFAQADRSVAVSCDAFDQDPWLLGTPGGTIDLRVGQLRAADPADRITRVTAVTPAPAGAPSPQWENFLHEATGGDRELRDFLQRYAGYGLTGLTTEQCLLFVFGLGGNGKGVFANVTRRLMGAYATVAAMSTFVSKAFEAHLEELASLDGARLVTASETEDGRNWDEVRVKQLTGGDTIRARFMRSNSYAFKPGFKLLFIGNSTPNLAHLDDAWRRRFHLAEFDHKPANPDPHLEDRLIDEEGPQILRWAIDGCLRWQEDGLRPPASVKAATAEYFAEQDVFGAWLSERCDVEPDNPHKKESSARLYESWCIYAHGRQQKPGTPQSFGREMRRKGLLSKKIRAVGGKGYEGVQLKTVETEWGGQ